eukprot:19378-Eustigmatos_ZCMA.PRE.1
MMISRKRTIRRRSRTMMRMRRTRSMSTAHPTRRVTKRSFKTVIVPSSTVTTTTATRTDWFMRLVGAEKNRIR